MKKKEIERILNLVFYKGRKSIKAEEMILMKKTEEETEMIKQNLPQCKKYERIKTPKGNFKLFLF